MPRSATQAPVDGDVIRAVARKHLGDEVATGPVTMLSDGFYSVAYAVELPGNAFDIVIKIEPPSQANRLTYERCSMETETRAIELLAARTAPGAVPLPVVVGHGTCKPGKDGTRGYLATRRFTGPTWRGARRRFGPGDAEAVERRAGQVQAAMNAVRGERFGYLVPDPARPVDAGTWEESFAAMMGNVYHDGSRFKVKLPVKQDRMEAILRRAGPALGEVTTPSFVHWDLWEGNVFLHKDDRGWDIEGIIDFERALWGDPLMEVLFRGKTKRAGVIEGHGGHVFDAPGAATRDALYELYLASIITVESTARRYPLAWRLGFVAFGRLVARRALRALDRLMP